MSRFLPWVALCACCALVPLAVPACSSSDDDDNAASGDSGASDELLSGDDDDSATIVFPDGEVPGFDAFVPGACYTSSFCVTGEVCGFPSNGAGGCVTQGSCVYAAPPVNDAGTVLVGCGCNGQNVPYVTPTLTSLPVLSPTACVDAGVVDSGTDGADAGDAAGDATIDGSLDASDAAD
jgi:hypothetical protein